MSGRRRWAVGVAVGAAVGLLGVALYNSGDTSRCDFAIPDTEDQRRWGLSSATEICDRGDEGLPLPPLDYGGETPGWEHVGNGWGILIASVGFGVLTWLVPVSIRRVQRPPRPPKPSPLAAEGRVYWSGDLGAWRTTASQPSGLYRWTYDPEAYAWTRGERVPTTGATRSETWALRRDELLREQNRLLEEQNRLRRASAAAARARQLARRSPAELAQSRALCAPLDRGRVSDTQGINLRRSARDRHSAPPSRERRQPGWRLDARRDNPDLGRRAAPAA